MLIQYFFKLPNKPDKNIQKRSHVVIRILAKQTMKPIENSTRRNGAAKKVFARQREMTNCTQQTQVLPYLSKKGKKCNYC